MQKERAIPLLEERNQFRLRGQESYGFLQGAFYTGNEVTRKAGIQDLESYYEVPEEDDMTVF